MQRSFLIQEGLFQWAGHRSIELRWYHSLFPNNRSYKKISFNTSRCTVTNIPPHILLARSRNNSLSDWFSWLLKFPPAPIRAQGSVVDLNVNMKVRVGTTEFTRSYWKTSFYAFKFLAIKLKIKLQIRKAKLIYSYLHSESDARSKLWNLSLISLPSGIERL